MLIATVNAGSSSIRLEAFEAEKGETRSLGRVAAAADTEARELFDHLAAETGLHELRPDAVAHRWVHGGPEIVAPTIITAQIDGALERTLSLAPTHNATSLAWLRASRSHLGQAAVHIAVPDTAYYADLPDIARRYALPQDLTARYGLRRYGFHGLAHQSMYEQWLGWQRTERPQTKIISLQLGSGCSITASRSGKPIDTSMGFTPLEGLVMASRCGDIDPGLILHLQRTTGMNIDDLEKLLFTGSGLKGVSGLSGDMRELLTTDAPAARLAVSMYCYRAKKYVGAYLAALGGADAILFGGGVGENSPAIRAAILEEMSWCGLSLAPEANAMPQAPERKISATDSRAEIAVVRVDEAGVMARHALDLLSSGNQTSRTL